jgi:hypothetical protein
VIYLKRTNLTRGLESPQAFSWGIAPRATAFSFTVNRDTPGFFFLVPSNFGAIVG